MKEKRGVFTKILVVAGTILVWIPLLAPVLFSTGAFIRSGMFRFDYLMPAELFMFALVGGILLLWAALRARRRRGLIVGAFAAAIVLPVLGSAIASLTGLASGETEPGGWQWALVLAALAAYCLALVAVGVGGILLLYDLFRKPRPPAADPAV
jgi:MFS family permease